MGGQSILAKQTYASRQEMLTHSTKAIQSFIEQDKQVHLVCPSFAWAQERKIQAAELFPRGVSILTWNSFFSEQWSLNGDGRTLVNPALRIKLLTLAGGNTAAKPETDNLPRLRGSLKATFAKELCSFMDEVAYSELWSAALLGNLDTLSAAETRVMNIITEYFNLLQAKTLIDKTELEHIVSLKHLTNTAIIFEGHNRLSTSQDRILETLGNSNEAWSFTDEGKASNYQHHAPELQQLADRLYSNKPGIVPSGAVLVGEAMGPRATPALATELIVNARNNGYEPKGIALVLPSVAKADPLLFGELAKNGIPFAASFSAPLKQTLLGSVVLAAFELAQYASELGNKQSLQLLFELVRSPYFSPSRETAWSLQRTWRGNRALEHSERLAMALNKLNPSFESLLQLATEPMTNEWSNNLVKCLNAMVDNSEKQGYRSSANSNDDRASIQAINNYISQVSSTNSLCSTSDLEQISVRLHRSNAEEPRNPKPNRITVISTSELGLQEYPLVIMGDLSADAYPMSEKTSSFTSLMHKLGVIPKKQLASRQRAILMHCIEAAVETFVFYREVFDADGGESRQSALWDELLANYYPAEDQKDSPVSKPEEIPPALVPYTTRIYEGNWLKERAEQLSTVGAKQYKRGVLDDEVIQTDFFKAPLSPTALEKYMQCPYAWFVDRRLKVQSIDEEFDAAHLGSFAHDVLHEFYRQIIERGMRRVTPANINEASHMLSTLFVDVQKHYAEQGNRLAVTASEQTQLNTIHLDLQELIKRDATFLPGFEPRYLEVEIGGKEKQEYAGIPIKGYIDRIDVNEEGKAVIIDYKMSKYMAKYGLKKEKPEFPAYLQGAIYARIAEQKFGITPLGSLFRSYGSEQTRGVFADSLFYIDDKSMRKTQGLSQNDAIPRQKRENPSAGEEISITALAYAEFLDMVEERVANAVERMRAGDIAPNPTTDEVCKYCAVAQTCSKKRGSSWA